MTRPPDAPHGGAMNFFQAQDQAKKRTFQLVVLFGAAVLAIIVAVYLTLLVAGELAVGASPGFDLGMFAIVAFGTGALIGGGSLFRSAQLRKGGPAVAEMLGGRRVDPATRDPDERRFVNVVEEMSIAAGMPVPAMYVMDREESINAFAAGYGIHDAAVAVTRGTLEQLERDELQGVVAHEFSHILNGDMRLNIRLIGLLFGILLLTVVGRGILRGGTRGSIIAGSRRGGKKGGGAGAVLAVGLSLILIGYIGVFFGKLIKAAVSRQREYLADAAAVQFTRNPNGIAGALQRIGAHPKRSRIQDHHAEELSHLFFANGLGSALAKATATHPPLEDRIQRIDPSWDGSFEVEPRREAVEGKGASGSGEADSGAPAGPFGDFGGLSGEGGSGGLTGLAAAAVLLEGIGRPQAEHVARAREVLERIPEDLRQAAHEPDSARALVLVLVGGPDDAARRARREAADAELLDRIDALEPLAEELDVRARLPLVDLALPSLADLDDDVAGELHRAVDRVVRADGQLRSFDFALMHILWKHLQASRGRARDGGRAPKSGGRIRSTEDARQELRVLLSALARAGARSETAVQSSWDEGARALEGALGEGGLLARSAVGLAEVDGALGRLERAPLDVRREVLRAAAAVTLADGVLNSDEAELLRAVAECLELPLPPLIPTAVRES